jgi:[acyl-carrier-protein] S-malonyltransferase
MPSAFLFPGQGSQYVGMAQKLCATLPAARRLFDEAAAVLGYDLLSLCAAGPAERLNATNVSQPAIFVASLAALEALRATRPEVESTVAAAAGLSLGEYSALVFAGVMSFADGLRVVKVRGEAMQAAAQATAGTMASVIGMETPQVEALCLQARSEGFVQVTNLLCPGNIVVSGVRPGVEAVERLVEAQGGKSIRLAVAGAFHTGLMKPADSALAAALANVTMQPARLPVWANTDARPHTDPSEIRSLLVRQVVEPVRWEESLRGMLAQGVETFYEIGPKRVLAGLLKRVQRKAEVVNIEA